MKRDLMSSRTSQNGGARGFLGAALPNGPDTGAAVSVHEQPRLTLAPPRPWSHTLVLKGNLDHDSAPELQDELECLHQEGVTALTLDLRELDALDPSGAQVIASHSASFKGRGRYFAVLVSSPVIDRTLNEAGGADLVMSPPTEDVARRFARSSSHMADLSTTMIRDIGLD